MYAPSETINLATNKKANTSGHFVIVGYNVISTPIHGLLASLEILFVLHSYEVTSNSNDTIQNYRYIIHGKS